MRHSILAAIGTAILLGAPGSSAFAASIDLGAASGYAILGLTGSNDQLSSGPLMINGNVGVASGAMLSMSSGTVTGLIETSLLSNVSLMGGTTFVDGSACSSAATCAGVSLVPGALASAQSAATALATAAATASSSPTQSFTSITGSQTITGNGGVNVIDVTGSTGIHLSGGALTISGGSNDTFIIDVSGSQGIQLSGGADIVLSGVNPDQVLFYLPGSASNILQTSGNGTDTAGIFLVPDGGGIQINGGIHDSEFIGDGPISFQSNAVIVPAPEIGRGLPGILAVAGLLLGAKLLGRGRMRRSPRTAVNHAAA